MQLNNGVIYKNDVINAAAEIMRPLKLAQLQTKAHQGSITAVPRQTVVPLHGIWCAANFYWKLYLNISTFTALNLLYVILNY
jgi:hypothetical protein